MSGIVTARRRNWTLEWREFVDASAEIKLSIRERGRGRSFGTWFRRRVRVKRQQPLRIEVLGPLDHGNRTEGCDGEHSAATQIVEGAHAVVCSKYVWLQVFCHSY